MNEKTGPIITLAAATVAAIGAIGPWTILGPLTETGMDGSGVIVLLGMVIVALFAGVSLTNGPNSARANLTMLVGLAAIVVASVALLNNTDRTLTLLGETFTATAGWGWWFSMIGSVGTVAGGIITGRS